jgi:hypothetical protein
MSIFARRGRCRIQELAEERRIADDKRTRSDRGSVPPSRVNGCTSRCISGVLGYRWRRGVALPTRVSEGWSASLPAQGHKCTSRVFPSFGMLGDGVNGRSLWRHDWAFPDERAASASASRSARAGRSCRIWELASLSLERFILPAGSMGTPYQMKTGDGLAVMFGDSILRV